MGRQRVVVEVSQTAGVCSLPLEKIKKECNARESWKDNLKAKDSEMKLRKKSQPFHNRFIS